ncbi:MAG: response regulator [Spirochaetaceae bacterium]|jgi:DNA-binding response OmpR family regulator|nr:response regulator [Spirochaetaceae bacterium]
MKKILVIDDSSLFRTFMKTQLEEYGFEVIEGINGLDGLTKMRNQIPDLIIMEYYLSRKSSLDLLKAKKINPNTSSIPVIIACNDINREKIVSVANFNVKKFLAKPIKIDLLLESVSEMLGVKISVDDTLCLLDAHLNDKILFIEIAKGFNREKISLLKYKVAELLKLHKIISPRILILMTDITYRDEDQIKLEALLQSVSAIVDNHEYIKILTVSDKIKEVLSTNMYYRDIDVVSYLEKAIDGLLGKKGLESMTYEQDNIHESLLRSSVDNSATSTVHLNFQDEKNLDNQIPKSSKKYRIAGVDDDIIVQALIKKTFSGFEWPVEIFDDGRDFLKILKNNVYDLIFLDLMMPDVNGFAVLQFIKDNGITTPVIVLSALTRKESVMKAMDFGIKSYMVKPLKPDGLILKAKEILNTMF